MMKRMILVFVAVLGLLIPIYSNAQYQPIHVVRSSSSSNTSSNYDSGRTMPYIKLKVGKGEEWTFAFFPDGHFNAYEWYGNSGKYSGGTKRKESIRKGTYSIKSNGDRKRIVYLYYDNGNEARCELIYNSNGRAELRTDYSGYDWVVHKEMY